MPAPFCQTHYIQSELIGLKRQIQSLSRRHLSPRNDLSPIERTKTPGQSF